MRRKVSSSFPGWHKQPAGCTWTSCHRFHPWVGELCFLLRLICRGCTPHLSSWPIPAGLSRKLVLSSPLLTWGVCRKRSLLKTQGVIMDRSAITWEPFRNAQPAAPPLSYWVKLVLTFQKYGHPYTVTYCLNPLFLIYCLEFVFWRKRPPNICFFLFFFFFDVGGKSQTFVIRGENSLGSIGIHWWFSRQKHDTYYLRYCGGHFEVGWGGKGRPAREGTESLLRGYICSERVGQSPRRSFEHEGGLFLPSPVSRDRLPASSLGAEGGGTGRRGKHHPEVFTPADPKAGWVSLQWFQGLLGLTLLPLNCQHLKFL